MKRIFIAAFTMLKSFLAFSAHAVSVEQPAWNSPDSSLLIGNEGHQGLGKKTALSKKKRTTRRKRQIREIDDEGHAR